MPPTVPTTTNYKPPLATARFLAASMGRLQELSERRRYWSAGHPDTIPLDAYQQKMLRGAIDVLVAEEARNLEFLLARALQEAGDLTRQQRAAALMNSGKEPT